MDAITIQEKISEHYKNEIKDYLKEKASPRSQFYTVDEQRTRLAAIEETLRAAGVTKEQINVLRSQARKEVLEA